MARAFHYEEREWTEPANPRPGEGYTSHSTTVRVYDYPGEDMGREDQERAALVALRRENVGNAADVAFELDILTDTAERLIERLYAQGRVHRVRRFSVGESPEATVDLIYYPAA